MDPAATRVAEALRAAGFAAPVALAAAAASDGDQWRALDDLCAALGPSREEALAAAREALAEAGAGDVDEEAATEILRTARVDELASLPREKHAPRGYTPAHSKALFQFEVPGIVQLGAKQYLAKLDVRLDGRDAYPFELPEMRFTHPTLQFPEAAAVNAAMHRAAAEMVGQPFLESLLEWCEGDDVADAVEKAREAMRASLAGANGDAGVATGGHLSRTFSKLELEAKAAEAEDARAAARRKQLMEINAREAAGDSPATALEASASPFPAPKPSGKDGAKRGIADSPKGSPTDSPRRPSAHAPSAEERAAATERRRALAREQAVLTAAADAERAKTEAEDAAIRTARASAEIAKAEARAANDARLTAESERMRAALEARVGDAADPALRKLMAQRRRLPAWAKTEELLAAVANHQVTIVAGETGCGKTTQLPQFILDDAIARGEGARTNLICTQPRRISATSVASRVAQERGEAIGKTVGYKIRLEAVTSSSTRILFVTTGVLLRRLAEDPLLAGVSHVVVDEVHERSLDSDFLLVLLRDVLPHRPSLRVVLMSATLNASAFGAYFKGAAVAQIPGFTFPVQEHYLEDILQVTSYVPSGEYLKRGGGGGSGGASSSGRAAGEFHAPDAAAEQKFMTELAQRGYLDGVRHALRAMDQSVINYDLAAKLIEHVCVSMDPGAILVFMPGLAEISKLHDMCASNPTIRDATGGAKYLIGLHSSLSTSEQKVIFEHPPNGTRKVVIATNIAETSITIDDVVYVIDSGKCKENGYDPNTRMQLLLERWVSRASAKQRRGRAGRVAAGRCFRLYTRLYHDAGFAEHTLPEIKRVPLEGLCLQIQLQKMAGGIAGFLGKALEPPEGDSVASAIKTLKQIGALNEKENLTALGQHLATLPVDVRVGKMLLYGAVLGCLSPVLTIAAVLGGRAPFVAPLEKRDEADAAKRMFAEDQSDHLTCLNAYTAWVDAKSLGKATEMQFTRENFLSFRTLEGIADLRNQFAQLLQEAGFLGAAPAAEAAGKGRPRAAGRPRRPRPRRGQALGSPRPSSGRPGLAPGEPELGKHEAGESRAGGWAVPQPREVRAVRQAGRAAAPDVPLRAGPRGANPGAPELGEPWL